MLYRVKLVEGDAGGKLLGFEQIIGRDIEIVLRLVKVLLLVEDRVGDIFHRCDLL